MISAYSAYLRGTETCLKSEGFAPAGTPYSAYLRGTETKSEYLKKFRRKNALS